MKTFKKFFSVFLCLLLFAAISVSPVKGSKLEDNFVSEAIARKIAINFITSEFSSSNTESWKPGVKINKTTVLYNLDDTPSAYLFKIDSKEDLSNGYVIVNANRDEVPIIEFSYTGECFINLALKETTKFIENSEPTKKVKIDKNKVYYTGGLNYFVEQQLDDNTSVFFDITSKNITVLQKSELKSLLNKKVSLKNQSYIENSRALWSKMESEPINDGSSTPPDSGSSPITSPDSHEIGYRSKIQKDVAGWNLYYDTTSMFSQGDNCAPVAGDNLCYYWYRTGRYSNLWPSSNTTYNRLYTLMKTNVGTSGTIRSNVPSAYQNYFSERGYSCSATYSTNYSDSKAKTEINNGYPFHLSITNHYYYCPDGGHAVIALGYIEYMYYYGSLSIYSRYLRISDGWITSATRFVWTSCDGDWDITTVHPN